MTLLDEAERAVGTLAEDELTFLAEPGDGAPQRERRLDVRGSVLRAKILHASASGPVSVTNVRVTTALSLAFTEIASAVHFGACQFDERIDLHDGAVAAWTMAACTMGVLDMRRVRVVGEVVLQRVVSSGIDLSDASIGGSLRLRSMKVTQDVGPAIAADRAQIGSSVEIEDLFCTGAVRFGSAQIGNAFLLENGRIFDSESTFALLLAEATVGGLLHISRTRLRGAIAFIGIRVDAPTMIEECCILSRNSVAVDCGRATFRGDVQIFGTIMRGSLLLIENECLRAVRIHRSRFQHREDGVALAIGRNTIGSTLELIGVRVDGSLVTERAKVAGHWTILDTEVNTAGPVALSGTFMHVHTASFVRSAFSSQVDLKSSRFDHDIVLHNSGFHRNPTGEVALVFDSAVTGGSVRLENETTVAGTVDLAWAKLGGFGVVGSFIGAGDGVALQCIGATVGFFSIQRSIVSGSISAENLRALGVLLFRDVTTGPLKLRHTTLDRGLQFYNVTVDGVLDLSSVRSGYDVHMAQGRIGDNQTSITAESARVDGSFTLTGVTLAGGCSITTAAITGLMKVADVEFTGTLSQGLSLNETAIGGRLYWKRVRGTNFVLNLGFATIGTIDDDENAWPKRGNLILNGATYRRFGLEVSPARRLRWLRLVPPENATPQIYEQLSAALRASGYDDEAVAGAIARQHFIRSTHTPLGPRWWTNVLLFLTVGHGYRARRALLWSAVVVALGAAVFSRAASEGFIRPTPGSTPVTFDAVVYSAESFLPLLATGHSTRFQLVADGCGRAVFAYAVFHRVVGWLLTALFLAGVTGVIRKT